MKKRFFYLNLISLYLNLLLCPFEIAKGATLTPIPGVPTKSISNVLSDATSWLLGFGVAVCLIALIWGGINYISSLGSQESAQGAKKTITYAIWGMIVIGFSYALIKLIDTIFT